jgi:hypothetical protein
MCKEQVRNLANAAARREGSRSRDIIYRRLKTKAIVDAATWIGAIREARASAPNDLLPDIQ